MVQNTSVSSIVVLNQWFLNTKRRMTSASIRNALVVGLVLIGVSQGDLFASTQRMENLLHLELQLIQFFDTHEWDSLDIPAIDGSFLRCLRSCGNVTKDPGSYLSNPLNGYLFLKRVSSDWPGFLESTISSYVQDDMSDQARSFIDAVYSQEDDEEEDALLALFRLQIMYNVEASELVHGNHIWAPVAVGFSFTTAFSLGGRALQLDHVDLARQWLLEAMRLHDGDHIPDEMQLDTLFTVLSELRRFKPNSTEEWVKTINTYLSSLFVTDGSEVTNTNLNGAEDIDPHKQKSIHPYADYVVPLCAGMSPIPGLREEHICFYSRTSAYSILNPMKSEVLSRDPWVALYHDVLTDAEINSVVDLSRHHLRRAGVSNKGMREVCPNRVASSSWLHDKEHEVIQRISFKTRIISGLNLDTAENLQVANYGMGGFYNVHYDAYQDNITREFGNRIATAMFYLSDVAAGGATVFPKLQLSVRPVRGAMLFWYNLLRSGKLDDRMLHTGCPVLSGSKWVANRWLREHGQEMYRPCLTSQGV